MTPLSLYKCLSDPTRLHTLLLLMEFNQLCVCELVQALNVSQPKLSRHLADLRQCQIVCDQRKGKWVYYALNPDLPTWAQQTLQLAFEESREALSSARGALSNHKTLCQTETA